MLGKFIRDLTNKVSTSMLTSTVSQNLFRTNIWQKYYLDIRICAIKKFLKVCQADRNARTKALIVFVLQNLT